MYAHQPPSRSQIGMILGSDTRLCATRMTTVCFEASKQDNGQSDQPPPCDADGVSVLPFFSLYVPMAATSGPFPEQTNDCRTFPLHVLMAGTLGPFLEHMLSVRRPYGRSTFSLQVLMAATFSPFFEHMLSV